MLYVATAHHRSPRWIDVQRRYLDEHLREPYKVYACLEGIDGRDERFDRVVPALGALPGKLNLLAMAIAQDAEPDDILVFLDGDAFPIADPMPVVRAALADTHLVAVQRRENLGDVQPHPCFCATTVGRWRAIGGDWSPAHPWVNDTGDEVTDAGGNLQFALDAHGASWTPLTRSNRVDLHPLYFAIYGGIVYHHGAGFRPGLSRLDIASLPPRGRGVTRLDRALWRRVDKRRRAAIAAHRVTSSDEMFRRLRDDSRFFEQLL